MKWVGMCGESGYGNGDWALGWESGYRCLRKFEFVFLLA